MHGTELLYDLDFFSFVIIMFTYNFMGWFYESTLYSIIEQKRFMNRGYFLGPYCPIYGIVCISGVYFLQDIESPVKVMLMGALLVTAIEYVTSYILEKLFDARYWDYSAYPLNINGRVSIVSSVFFGFAVMFGVKVLHPIMEELVGKMPNDICIITAVAILAIFITDGILTTISMCNLNNKCREIYEYLSKYVDEKFENMTDKSKFLDENLIIDKKNEISVVLKNVYNLKGIQNLKTITLKKESSENSTNNVVYNIKKTPTLKGVKSFKDINNLKGITRRFKDSEMHFFRAFPYFKSNKYNDLIQKIKNTQTTKMDNK